METPSERAPVRRVVFEARPVPRPDAPGSFARRTGGLMAVLFTVAVFGLIVLGGNVVWTMVDTPDRPPAPPSWMEPVQAPEREAQRPDRETTPPQPSPGPASGGAGDSSGDRVTSVPEPADDDSPGSGDDDVATSSGSGSEVARSSSDDSSGSGSHDRARSPG
ncbi:MAG TPA: hypothetical protein VF728_03390, partial [Nocardioides sp.]